MTDASRFVGEGEVVAELRRLGGGEGHLVGVLGANGGGVGVGGC